VYSVCLKHSDKNKDNSSTQNKYGSSRKHLSGNELFCILTERLFSKMYACNTQHFMCNWHFTFTAPFPIPVVSEAPHDPKQVFKTHGQVWLWTVAPAQRFQRGCKLFDRHQNCIVEMFLHFQLQLNSLGFVSVSAGENVKEWSRVNVGAVLLVFAHAHC